ncbi:TPA: hypothetical protein IAC10_14800 [Candidatus Scatousia excrementigallinarum]|uniref:Uncharacterized protein n=1 Tax=Candidatus Scatousia excrementigallinarum TaxID=2840935 RepID=A0A9D1F1I7_9BACT|nr:hypothetical protein [Candidatus Scatousia excrementigallinarum]
MKVAVITRHAITNYGSLLQAIATQHLVESFGHTCEVIDYILLETIILGGESYLRIKKEAIISSVL